MFRSLRRHRTTLAVGLAVGLSGGSLFADESAEAVAPVESPAVTFTESASRPAQLPASIVIGSREAQRELPGSGFYLETEDIRRFNYDMIDQVLRKVPGVYTRSEDGFGLFPNISLRGVDSGRSAKVTIMEDGILMAPAPYSAPAAYYSPTTGRMSGIEVLKGSSQIRFGPHITGGAINYLSTPIPQQQAAYLRTTYGTDNDVLIHGWVGDTIDMGNAGRLGFLVEGFFRNNDGFREFNPTTDDFRGGDTGFSNVEPMIKLAWEPVSSMYQRFELKLGYTDREADETYLGLSEADIDSNPEDRYPATRFDHIDQRHVRVSGSYYIELTPELSLETVGYYNEFTRKWFKLQSVNGNNLSVALASGGADLDVLKGEGAGTFNVRGNNREYESYGFQVIPRYNFQIGETSHELEVGIRYHYDSERRKQNSVDFTQDGGGNIIGSVQNPDGSAGNRLAETDALAIHVQDRISWGRWTFVPGFRYEHLWHSYTDFQSNPMDIVSAKDSGTMDLFGGGLGITYDVNEDIQLFGGVHAGFSPPGPRAALRDGLEEEQSIALELGTRFQIPQHGFSAEVTGFFTYFDNLIAIDNVGGVGSIDGTAENVGRINSFGLELYMEYDPGVAYDWGFSMPNFISVTLTEAELQSDTGGGPESIFSGGVKGNKAPYIPSYQVTVGTGIEIEQFGIFLTGNFVGKQYTTASNTSAQERPDGTPDSRFGELDSRIVVDLSAYYQFNENVKIIGGIHNLFDEEYVTSRIPHGPRAGRPLSAYIGVEMIW